MLKKSETSITVMEVKRGQITYCLRGVTPMIFNRVNEKAKRELLLPAGRKTAADKQGSLKHDPVSEFRLSAYRHAVDDRPTRLYMPPTAFKAATATSALDMPGAKKSQIGRLVWVEGAQVDIYGVPKLFMSVVRSADINRTPDIRTRALLPRWACVVTISFAQPLLKEAVISNLLASAGLTVGIGDYRQEKGKGSYGQFSLVGQDDAELIDILATEGRDAQDAALDAAEPYDEDSRELLDWYREEVQRRTSSGRPSVKLEAVA